MPLTNSLHLTRFGASFSAEFQLCPCSFNSDSVSLRQVFLGRPLLLLPCGFHLRACLVMLFGGFLSVWPIHAHFFFLISVFMWSWFALCQRSPFQTLFFDNMAFVVLHVSAPYKSTDFTFELKDFHFGASWDVHGTPYFP